MSDLLDEPGDVPANTSADEIENANRPVRPWLGKVAVYLASFAGGWAVSDVRSSLGYHGFAGAIALSAAVAAATWIRGLDPCARLPRYALWFFMIPVVCLAFVGAFSSGPTVSILTVIAAAMTVGAVLMTRELLSLAVLLQGAAFVATGATGVAYGVAAAADHHAFLGTASIALGVAFTAYGVTAFTERDALMEIAKSVYAIAAIPFAVAVTVDRGVRVGATLSAGPANLAIGAGIAGAAASIVWWIASLTGRYALAVGALIAYGAACIAIGAANIANGNALPGAAACMALGAASVAFAAARIGPHTIVVRIRQMVDWATKAPQEIEDHKAEPGSGNV